MNRTDRQQMLVVTRFAVPQTLGDAEFASCSQVICRAVSQTPASHL